MGVCVGRFGDTAVENIWYRTMKPKLEPIGLGWASIQALRRTHASLGQEVGVDPKVAADQRGHGIAGCSHQDRYR
jgi:hypothetical protein